MIHLDTSFVIDFLREVTLGREGPARRFMDTMLDEPVGISIFAVCELFMGAELSGRPDRETARIQSICENLHIDYPDSRFAPAFAKHYTRQEKSGQRVATMDLLIATSATLADAPLVTGNTRDFSRVAGLKLMGY